MILFLEVFMFRLQESMSEEGSVCRVQEESKVKMIRDYWCRWEDSRHEEKDVLSEK
jgi:hypothetical protein